MKSLTIPSVAAALCWASVGFSAPVCEYADSDSDGDGWGWENHQSCIVSDSSTGEISQIASTASSQSSTAHAPICTTKDTDSDGDGWGWELNRSCRVAADTQSVGEAAALPEVTEDDGVADEVVTSEETELEADADDETPTDVTEVPEVAAATNTPDPESGIQSGLHRGAHPICSNVSADSDGDGWGWEFNRSCRVAVTTQSVGEAAASPEITQDEMVADEETEVPEVAAASNAPHPESDIQDGLYQGTHPICSSASADSDDDGWGYEFNHSCKVIEGYVSPDAIALTPPEGNDSGNKVGRIYIQNFSAADIGLYQADQLNGDWETPLWHLGFDQGRVSIVDTDGANGKAMEVTYPAGKYGAGGASAFLSDVQFGMGLPKNYEELYVAYDIRFSPGFDFVRGGKLPGLCGADVNQAPSTGCNTGGGYPTGYDGWSARGMWRENGVLENYIYHASQRNYYGDDEFWDIRATPGVWHKIQHRVVLNTPGLKNGILEAWFDGVKVLSLNNLEYRKTSSIGINLFYFSTFFGGNDASWAPSTDQKMMFDNFVISTNEIN